MPRWNVSKGSFRAELFPDNSRQLRFGNTVSNFGLAFFKTVTILRKYVGFGRFLTRTANWVERFRFPSPAPLQRIPSKNKEIEGVLRVNFF
jgi:hypothetical protein